MILAVSLQKGNGQGWPRNMKHISQYIYLVPCPFTSPVPIILLISHTLHRAASDTQHSPNTNIYLNTHAEEIGPVNEASGFSNYYIMGTQIAKISQPVNQGYSTKSPVENKQQSIFSQKGKYGHLQITLPQVIKKTPAFPKPLSLT